MTFFILFNKETLEKMIISSYSNIFIVYENTMHADIFIVRRDCFQIFSDIFISRKGDIFLVFIQNRCSFICSRYGNVTFSDYRNVRKSPKIWSFRIFSRIYNIRKDAILCSVINEFFRPDLELELVQLLIFCMNDQEFMTNLNYGLLYFLLQHHQSW